MRLGITTTVPIEAILAGGHTPVDLNNIFVTDSDPVHFINAAHDDGFPRSMCSWIKGQYSVITETNSFDAIIAVTTGDCSNTHAMIELLEDQKIPVHRFAYPIENKSKYAYNEMSNNIQRLSDFLQTPMFHVFEQFDKMHSLRAKLMELDKLTINGYVTGAENHIWLVSSSDFNSNIAKYEQDLTDFIAIAKDRKPVSYEVRLGYVGVPPIITDLFDFVTTKKAGFFFNEVQRQFTIPSRSNDMIQRYLDYTYPYDIFTRLEDINIEIKERKLDGLVHYVQSFCHRQIQDILLKKHVNVPVLTIEGDGPGELNERSKIRIESFIEMLQERKKHVL